MFFEASRGLGRKYYSDGRAEKGFFSFSLKPPERITAQLGSTSPSPFGGIVFSIVYCPEKEVN